MVGAVENNSRYDSFIDEISPFISIDIPRDLVDILQEYFFFESICVRVGVQNPM